MTTKAKGDSIRQKIIDLSKKLRVDHSSIETVFLIERLVARLISNKTLAKNLVFKGGFVGLKIYESPRYTVDLDALLVKSNIESTLELVKEKAESDLNDGVWFRFESQVNPAPQEAITQALFQKNEEISWSVYPIETICAEKLHALISHGDLNSRSKDIHDLAIFLPKADGKTLKEAIKKVLFFVKLRCLQVF